LNKNRKADLIGKAVYVKPEVTTYSEDDILELIGPAHTHGSDFPGNGLHLGWGKGRGNPHK
jgi:hypothetical protein